MQPQRAISVLALLPDHKNHKRLDFTSCSRRKLKKETLLSAQYSFRNKASYLCWTMCNLWSGIGKADAPSNKMGPNEVHPTSSQFSNNSDSEHRFTSEKLSRSFLEPSSFESRRCEKEFELRFGLIWGSALLLSSFRCLPERLLPKRRWNI